MQILNRAKNAELDIISGSESKSNVLDEANRRSAKAGYTDRDGQPMTSRRTSYSKGDSRRPHNRKRYQENYVRIFGE
jgi:hypothetical protein